MGSAIELSRLHRARRRLAALLALVAALLSGALATTPAWAAEAGVGVNDPNGMQLGAVRSLGVHWVRMFVSWPALQPTPAPVSAQVLASYEQLFAQYPAGTKLILDVVNSPRWENGSTNPHSAPANPYDYAAFLGTLARRWAGRVAAYEIWNEENSSTWWTGGSDPGAYARLLRAAYPAVKAADPSAALVLGGLVGNDYLFLQGVYQAGGRGSFDAVGVHTDTACNILSPYDFLRGPDNRMIPDSFLAYREVRATMLANGDDKPIWMTEMSWRTTSATCPEGAFAGQKAEGVTPEQQAVFLKQGYHCLAQDPYVQVGLWFPVQDERRILSGLVRANGTRKPSFYAMRSYVRNGDQLKEPCGVLSGPRITLLSPANGTRYRGPLRIHVFATSPLGVFRITLKIDGRLIRNYGGSRYPSRLSGFLDWQGAKHISPGRHTLTFLAYDRERNVAETSVTINHRPGNAHRTVNNHGHARKHKAVKERRAAEKLPG
jgi:hypothetical protein